MWVGVIMMPKKGTFMKSKHIHIEVKSGHANLTKKQKEFRNNNRNHYEIERTDTFWWY